jgi:hypothetical protein
MKTCLTACALFAALALSGCASSGVIEARETDTAHRVTPVTMHWAAQGDGNDGAIWTMLADGEQFRGKFVQASRTRLVGGWPWWDDWPATEAVTVYSGDVAATLFGERGEVMRCRFELASPSDGMRSGGLGHCQVRGGPRLDAVL